MRCCHNSNLSTNQKHRVISTILLNIVYICDVVYVCGACGGAHPLLSAERLTVTATSLRSSF